MKPLCLVFLALLSCALIAQAAPAPLPSVDLVLVISLDQFPYEYMTRFRPHFTGGLAMLLDRGAVFTNAVYKHAQCNTGPGHAVILSGSYGAENGIVSNNWYDRALGRTVYCVEDESVSLLGGKGDGRSPARFEASTFGDMLRLHTGFESRVISIANKDRAAILMAGRMPTGVYWMADSAFVSSTYYLNALPVWLKEFNGSGMINSYFGALWNQSLPETAFSGMDQDDAPYEESRDGLGRTFPHRITGTDRSHLTSSYYSALWTSPYGVMLPAEAARRAVLGERLGKRGVTDLLCIGFSTTDYVGHAYGPHSREILEIAVAVDRTLGEFFSFIDSTVGLQRCIIALTSDHGVSPIPEYLMAHVPGASAGRIPGDLVRNTAEASLTTVFGRPPAPSWVEAVVERNVYLRRTALQKKNISLSRAAAIVAEKLRQLPGVAHAWNLLDLSGSDGTGLTERVRLSYRPDRCGEVFYMLKPFYLEGGHSGTSHGDPYDYNAHVPLILMGVGIRQGVYDQDASPADLAPTLSALLGVEFPSGRTGKVLREALDRK
jgi:predicted AlkP superfamily pyrophosphatase or phosphodiesterase